MYQKLRCVFVLGAMITILIQCAYPQKLWEATVAESKGEPYNPYYFSTPEPVVDSYSTYISYDHKGRVIVTEGYHSNTRLYNTHIRRLRNKK